MRRQPIRLHARRELETHMTGLLLHLEAIGLRAEASAVRTELAMLAQVHR